MATSTRPELAVEQRDERGSRSARRLRRAGFVPGILYGGTDSDPVAFQVGARELRNVLIDGSALIDVKIGGDRSVPAIVKDRQLHPVRDEVMHIDFLEVRLDEKIASMVSIELEGVEDSPGVDEGGVLEHITREVEVMALPTDIPERIVVDVSGLEMAQTLTLAEVAVPEGVELVEENPDEVTVATVVVPTKVEEPEVEEETELIGEDGEPVEAAEGDAEGGGDSDAGDSGDSGGE